MTRSLLASSMQARSISSRPAASEPHVPRCPWQNGKADRFNRTLASEWAYRRVFISNADRAAALPNFLDYCHHRRRQTALGGQPPISRLSPT
jgi:transposase InsO family protein